MSVTALLSVLSPERRCVLLDSDGQLQDVLIDPGGEGLRLGDVFLARVTGRDSGLQAAFVDLGTGPPALLQAEGKAESLPLEGASVAVRVSRAPSPGKGARVKRSAEHPTDDGGAVPRLLARGEDPLLALLLRQPLDSLFCDDAETARQLSAEAPELAAAMRVVQAPAISEDVEDALEALLHPEVALPGGGSLLIEPTRTLVAIDVNSAGHGATRGGGRRRALDVNCEAAREIARQLRLRCLSGLMVVDFLTLKAPKDRDAVREALVAALADDPEPTRVFRLSPSGLLEMTRRRSRPALHELLTTAGPLVGGGVLSSHACAMAALRALQASGPAARPRLVVSPGVAAALEEGSAAAARRWLDARRGVAVVIERDATCHDEAWELLLT